MIEFIDPDVQHRYDDLLQRQDELSSDLEDVEDEINSLIANNEKA